MLKIGVAGVGGISGAHIPCWQEMNETELTAICDIRPEQMEKYDGVKKYTDLDEMLDQEHIDILDICLPTYLHADTAVKAMDRGIHVLCEKPVSLKKEDAVRVYEAARKNNVRFMVAHVLRFWREYVFVKEIYDSGKYGKLLSGNMSRIGVRPKWSWDNWMMDENRSGLVPFDLHIHDLDYMVYVFGKPVNVTCFRAQHPQQDYLNVTYQFGDFFINSEAAWYDSPYPFTASFRFQFEKAVIAMEGGKLTVYEQSGNIYDLQDNGEKKDTGSINLPKSDAYANEIRYFTECVLSGKNADIVKPWELETVIDILHTL